MAPQFTDRDLRDCHQIFARGHDHLRAELLASLPVPESSPGISSPRSPYHRSLGFRVVFAAAAAVLLVIGLQALLDLGSDNAAIRPIAEPISQALTPQAAWAAALEQARQVDSVYMILTTPRPDGSGPSVRLWWRRPHDFRMQFDNGLVLTGNQHVRCTFDPDKNTLTLTDADSPGLEMALLGELGRIFTTDYGLSREWISATHAVAVESAVYKGEDCRRVTVKRGDRVYQYIIDKNTNMIYEGTLRSTLDPARVLSHMEVRALDKQYPDSLFTVPRAAGMTVIDRRSSTP